MAQTTWTQQAGTFARLTVTASVSQSVAFMGRRPMGFMTRQALIVPTWRYANRPAARDGLLAIRAEYVTRLARLTGVDLSRNGIRSAGTVANLGALLGVQLDPRKVTRSDALSAMADTGTARVKTLARAIALLDGKVSAIREERAAQRVKRSKAQTFKGYRHALPSAEVLNRVRFLQSQPVRLTRSGSLDAVAMLTRSDVMSGPVSTAQSLVTREQALPVTGRRLDGTERYEQAAGRAYALGLGSIGDMALSAMAAFLLGTYAR